MQHDIPLVPFETHLLPQGKVRLRIVEAKDIDLIKDTINNHPAFALAMRSETETDHFMSMATLVNIVDFELLEGGILGITVEGEQLITLDGVNIDDHGIRHALYHEFDNWPLPPSVDAADMKQKLCELINRHHSIKCLYSNIEDLPIDWYVCRWLELIPIDPKIKTYLLQQPSADMAIEVINTVIHNRH